MTNRSVPIPYIDLPPPPRPQFCSLCNFAFPVDPYINTPQAGVFFQEPFVLTRTLEKVRNGKNIEVRMYLCTACAQTIHLRLTSY